MAFGPVSIVPGVLSTWDVAKSAPFATKATAVVGNSQLGLFTFMDQLRQSGWSAVDANGATFTATWNTPGATPTYFNVTEHAYSMFQLMFAIVTVAIISGGVVGRIKYAWFMAFAAIWHLCIYCPLAHWIFFYDGWLFTFGVLDFAGGLVVHLASGASALTLAYWLGNSKRARHDPHSVPYVLLGAALLWFGCELPSSLLLVVVVVVVVVSRKRARPSARAPERRAPPLLLLPTRRPPPAPNPPPSPNCRQSLSSPAGFGFNAGSSIGAGSNAGARVFVNTQLATAMAMMTWGLMEMVFGGDTLFTGRASAVGAATGAVVGLVAITPACGYVTQMWSLFIGFITVVVCYFAPRFVRLLGIDDRLDCFAYHGVGGTMGALLTGLFATADWAPPNVRIQVEGTGVREGGPLRRRTHARTRRADARTRAPALVLAVAQRPRAPHAPPLPPPAPQQVVNGGFYGNGKQFGIQIAGVLVTLAMSIIGTTIIFWVLQVAAWALKTDMRIPDAHAGELDVSQHGEKAYYRATRSMASEAPAAAAAAAATPSTAKEPPKEEASAGLQIRAVSIDVKGGEAANA